MLFSRKIYSEALILSPLLPAYYLLSLHIHNLYVYLHKHLKDMRILLIGLLFISSLLSLQAQPKEEIRATWLTTLGGMDTESEFDQGN